MEYLKTITIFIIAALGELGGTYAFWRWRREGGTPWLIALGLMAFLGYAVIQTYQPEDNYGRLYAAYAGFFLVGAMIWGWAVDGMAPDRFDVVGGAIALVGAAVILWGRNLLS